MSLGNSPEIGRADLLCAEFCESYAAWQADPEIVTHFYEYSPHHNGGWSILNKALVEIAKKTCRGLVQVDMPKGRVIDDGLVLSESETRPFDIFMHPAVLGRDDSVVLDEYRNRPTLA